MTTDVLSPRDAAIASLSNTLDGALDASRDEIGAIAKIACAIVGMVNSGNGDGVTLALAGKSPRDIYIDADTLANYAAGTLPKDKDADMPRAADVLAVLQAQSPKIGRTQIALADLAETMKGKPAGERAKLSAEYDRLSRMLNTVKQPIRRGAMLAAYVLTYRGADNTAYFDPASVTQRAGVLYATPHASVDDDDEPRPEGVSLAIAAEYFAKPKAPKASTANVSRTAAHTGVASDDNGDAQAVTIRAEGVRRGGADRDKLAAALAVLAGFLSDLDGAPTTAERDAMLRLYVTCERHFADDDFAKIAEMRDAFAGE